MPTSVKIKDYNETLDLQRLSFPIAHPSMFRRFGFRVTESVEGLKSTNWPYGYGRSIETDQEQMLDYLHAPNCHMISAQQIQALDFSLLDTIKHLLKGSKDTK